MPTTSNAPRPRLTLVCSEAVEAETPGPHPACSGGYCGCECHVPAPEPAGDRPALPRGRYGRAPDQALAQLRRIRDARRRRRGGAR